MFEDMTFPEALSLVISEINKDESKSDDLIKEFMQLCYSGVFI